MLKNMRRVFSMLFFTVIFFSTTLFAAEYNIENYKVEANVNEDGSVNIVEYLKYHFDESMNGLYRDILYRYTFEGQKDGMDATSSRYQGSDISNIRVYTSDTSFGSMTEANVISESEAYNGLSDVYSLQDNINNGYRTKIKVYSPVSEGNYKYVKYEYTIEDVVANYNDYAELYWNFVGGDWECGIGNLEVTVTYPVFENIKAYSHTYAKLDNLQILSNKVTMKVSNISAGTAVDLRSVFPNSFMKNVSKNIYQNYDFNTLKSIEDKSTKDREKYDLSNKIWFFYAGLNLFIFIALIVKASKYRNKNIKTYGKVEHYTDLPGIYSLGEYNCIKNRMFGYSDPNLIVATILDLSSRKYIKMEALKKAGLFGDKYEYFVSVDTTKRLDDLNEYEKELLNYIFNKKFDNKLDVSDFTENRIELNERFKELGLDYTLGAKYRKACTDKTTANAKKMYNDVPKSIWKTYFYAFLIVAIVAIINIFFISPLVSKEDMIFGVLFAGIFTFVFLAIIVDSTGRSLKDEYTDEYNKLLGLQKYLAEYSLIKQRYPIELVLWDKYLVFASLFGIADKVAKEFKEELLNQGYDENYIYTTYPMIHMGMHASSFASTAGSASGTSSSGGYSGGGGGGGGRRWRWRRCLLISKKKRTEQNKKDNKIQV